MSNTKKVKSVIFRESSILALVIILSGTFWGLGNRNPSTPVRVDRLTVVIIEETESRDSLPQSQLNAINSKKWRDYLFKNNGQWRVIDQHANISNENKWVKESFSLKRDSIPWLIIADVNRLRSMPMPANIEVFMQEIKQ